MKGTRVINNIFPDTMWKLAPVPGKAGSEAVCENNIKEANAGYLEWLNEYSCMYWPEGSSFQLVADSPCIDAADVIPGITDGHVGAAPDIGAYEYGAQPWTAGCDLAMEIDWADTLP